MAIRINPRTTTQARAMVAVHIRVDVDEDKMAQHDAHGSVRFVSKQLEKGGHGVAHSFVTERHMFGSPDKDAAIPITGQIGGLAYAGLNARSEEFAIQVL